MEQRERLRKKKQIEEMARKIGELYKDPPQDIPKYDLNIATYLYDAGYRKQSDIENCIPLDVHEALKQRAVEIAKADVAKEIFEEIESMLIRYTFEDGYGEYISTDLVDEFAELKKKYTEEKKCPSVN